MDKKAAAFSEAAGCAVIYAAAVFLHFVYPLSGGSALSMMFGAVNESVWEHSKIFCVAYIGWSLLQLCWLRVRFRQYVAAKCIGLYALAGLVIGGYYACIAAFGRDVFWADIAASLISVILVQTLTWKLETDDNRIEDFFAPALMLIMLYYLMFLSFTAYPPKTELFRDPVGGGFGIAERMVEKRRT